MTGVDPKRPFSQLVSGSAVFTLLRSTFLEESNFVAKRIVAILIEVEIAAACLSPSPNFPKILEMNSLMEAVFVATGPLSVNGRVA